MSALTFSDAGDLGTFDVPLRRLHADCRLLERAKGDARIDDGLSVVVDEFERGHLHLVADERDDAGGGVSGEQVADPELIGGEGAFAGESRPLEPGEGEREVAACATPETSVPPGRGFADLSEWEIVDGDLQAGDVFAGVVVVVAFPHPAERPPAAEQVELLGIDLGVFAVGDTVDVDLHVAELSIAIDEFLAMQLEGEARVPPAHRRKRRGFHRRCLRP